MFVCCLCIIIRMSNWNDKRAITSWFLHSSLSSSLNWKWQSVEATENFLLSMWNTHWEKLILIAYNRRLLNNIIKLVNVFHCYKHITNGLSVSVCDFWSVQIIGFATFSLCVSILCLHYGDAPTFDMIIVHILDGNVIGAEQTTSTFSSV